jgi:hypothetical protein
MTRLCDRCGKPYYRRNLTEVWDAQNPGSRAGWHKTQARVCTTCLNATGARRLLMMANVRIGQAPRRDRRTG